MKKKKSHSLKYPEGSYSYLEKKRDEKHLQGFDEDEKATIKLIAQIFVDSILKKAGELKSERPEKET